MAEKYILMVFDKGLGYREESMILARVLSGNTIGASCGPVNFCIFESNYDLDYISGLFKEQNIEFVLSKECDAKYLLPEEFMKRFADPLKKVSLADQLKDAIEKEDYVVAAKLKELLDKTPGHETERKS